MSFGTFGKATRGYLRLCKLVTGETVIGIKAGDGGIGEPLVVDLMNREGEEKPSIVVSMSFIPYGLVDLNALPEVEIPQSAIILELPVTDRTAQLYFDSKNRISQLIKEEQDAAEARAVAEAEHVAEDVDAPCAQTEQTTNN